MGKIDKPTALPELNETKGIKEINQEVSDGRLDTKEQVVLPALLNKLSEYGFTPTVKKEDDSALSVLHCVKPTEQGNLEIDLTISRRFPVRNLSDAYLLYIRKKEIKMQTDEADNQVSRNDKYHSGGLLKKLGIEDFQVDKIMSIVEKFLKDDEAEEIETQELKKAA